MSDCLTYTLGRKDISTDVDTLVLLFSQAGQQWSSFGDHAESPDTSGSPVFGFHDLVQACWSFLTKFFCSSLSLNWLLWVFIHPISSNNDDSPRSCVEDWRRRLDFTSDVWSLGATWPACRRENGLVCQKSFKGSPLGPGNFDWTFALLDIFRAAGLETHFIYFENSAGEEMSFWLMEPVFESVLRSYYSFLHPSMWTVV